MDHDSNTTPFDIGYKKPPTATQSQKGRSGNPKGRPKGSRSLATLIRESGRQLVRVSGLHGVKVVTKQEAIFMQLSNKAAQGDLAATRIYLPLIRAAESAEQGTIDRNVAPREMDMAVMKGLAARWRSLSEIAGNVPATNQQEEQL